MNRPSRGERWSATTTRQIGFFLLPTRVSRTRTLISALRLATAGQLLQVGHLPLRQRAHQLLHLAELIDELADRLHGRPGPARYPPSARAVDDRRVGALLGRHRLDDRLEPVELALVEVHVAELLPHSRHHLQETLQRAHLADLLELLEEVVERELLLADLSLELLGLALVHLALGLLDQRHDVAH